MANTSAAKKALRSSATKNKVNNARRNRIRSFARKVTDAIKSNDAKAAAEALKNLQPELMRGVTKKVMKLNTASRKLSAFSAQIKKIGKK